MSTITRGNVVWALMACYKGSHGLRLGSKNAKTLSDLAAHYKVKKFLTTAQIDLAYELLPELALEHPKMASLPPDARADKPAPVLKEKEAIIKDGMILIPNYLIDPVRPEFYDAFRNTQLLSGVKTTKVPLSWVSIDNLEDLDIPMSEDIANWRASFYRGSLPELDFSDLKRTLLEHQPFAVQCIAAQSGRVLLADDMGLGKAQPLSAIIQTPNGPKTMGDIQKGDLVFSHDGRAYPVAGVHPQGMRPIYRISFSDGTATECCNEHLWTLTTPLKKSRGKSWSVKKLEEFKDNLQDKNGNFRYHIPVTEPLQYNKKELKVHPYLMGLILAEGTVGASVTISNPEEKIRNYVETLIPDTLKLQVSKNGAAYAISSGKVGRQINPVLTACKEYGLQFKTSWTKFIPQEYLYSDVQDRIALLQGFLDGDGECSDPHTVQATTASDKLYTGITHIVESLGGQVIRPKQKIGRIGRKVYGPYWHFTIKMPANISPFLCARKGDKYKPVSKCPPARLIRNIAHIGEASCQCITVDSPDHTYLTDNHIVTHNSTEAATWAYLFPEQALPMVICCPASLKINWRREIEAVFGKGQLNIEIIDGLPTSKKPPKVDILILNYDIMGHKTLTAKQRKEIEKQLAYDKKNVSFPTHIVETSKKNVRVRTGWAQFLSKSGHYKTVIFDEGQYLKNFDSSRTKACIGFARTCRHVLWLSGTPLEQRPIELWTAINLLAPGMFTNKEEFGKAFCNGKRNGYGAWDYNGSRYAPALNDWLRRTIMVRRRKDILKNLPEKTKCVTLLPMSSSGMREYERAESNFLQWYRRLKGDAAAERANKAEHLARMAALKQLAWKAKVPAVHEWLENFFDLEDKLVLFYEFKETGKDLIRIMDDLNIGWVQVDGSTPTQKRQTLVDKFNDSLNTRAFIGQIVACGTGFTLVSANNSVTMNYLWNPAKHMQAEDRLYRIGQKKSVSSWYLPVADTIEDDIMTMLEQKQDVVAQVLDGLEADPTPVLNIVTRLMFSRRGG